MRILQLVTARQLRGAEIFAAQLTRHLMDEGHDVLYMSMYSHTGDVLDIEGIEHVDLHVRKIGGLNWKLIKALKDEIIKYKPDIVQANAGDTLKYAVFVKLLFGLNHKIIFRNASMVSLYLKSFFQKQLYFFLYKYVNHIISVSERSKHDFVSLFPSCSTKIEVVTIGIEKKEIVIQVNKDKQRKAIVHVGGFTFEKNHEGLLRIFSKILMDYPDAILWLIGDGPRKPIIEQLAIDMGLDQSVRFMGFVNNPMDHIASADLLVLPSHIEGLPGVILEAQYCKTPVVAYDVGGISEVVISEVSGWLVPKDDEEAFEQSVVEVLLGGEKVSLVVENAYQNVLNNFDNKVIAQRFLKVYEKVLKS